jgi:hypothetical protein
MHCDTNGIVVEIVIVFLLLLSCAVGWWMGHFQVWILHSKINRLKNECHRLWLELQERDAQSRQSAGRERPLTLPSRNTLPMSIERTRSTYYSRVYSALMMLWQPLAAIVGKTN